MKGSATHSLLAMLGVASGTWTFLCATSLAFGQGTSPTLSEGPGFAANYPGDEGLECDRRVLFVEDFESGAVRELGDRWGNATQPENLSFS